MDLIRSITKNIVVNNEPVSTEVPIRDVGDCILMILEICLQPPSMIVWDGTTVNAFNLFNLFMQF